MTNPYQSPTEPAPPLEGPRPWLPAVALVAGGVFAAVVGMVAAGMLAPLRGIVLAVGCAVVAIAAYLAAMPPAQRALSDRRRRRTVMTDDMLDAQGADYQQALRQLEDGRPLVFRGVMFHFVPAEEAAGALTAATAIARAEDDRARQAALHVRQVADELLDRSPDLADLAGGRPLLIEFFASYEAVDEVIGRMVGDHVTWID